MPAPWHRLALSSLLLVVLLASVAAVLGLLGGLVLLPQLGAVGWVAIGLLLFLGVQLALFRLFGLRSQADEESEARAGDDAPAPPPEEDEDTTGDWRAWRG